MNRIALCVLFVLWAMAALAQSVIFRGLGHPLKVETNAAIVWAAQTNDLPRGFWTYRAVRPDDLPKGLVSNLVALGSFTPKDRETVEGYPRIISYAKNNGKVSFRINPDWLWIVYTDQNAKDMQVTEGVPSPEEVFQIATNWLPKLGIDRNELVKEHQTSEIRRSVAPGTVYLYDRSGSGPAYATNTYYREVGFKRTLDGVPISGGSARGGCAIQIGHHAKIAEIFVSWRKYRRDKYYRTARPEMFLAWIRTGRAVWCPQIDDASAPDWSTLRKITIRKVTPYYYSEGFSEFEKPLNWAAPYAELEAVVETAQASWHVYIDCPITEEGLAIRK